MADLLASGTAWLGAQLKEHASTAVTYSRDGASLPLQATVGATEFDVQDGDAGIRRVVSRDYLVLLADLASLSEPQRGDRIVEPAGTFEVMSPGGGDQVFSLDPQRVMARIHTKRIA